MQNDNLKTEVVILLKKAAYDLKDITENISDSEPSGAVVDLNKLRAEAACLKNLKS